MSHPLQIICSAVALFPLTVCAYASATPVELPSTSTDVQWSALSASDQQIIWLGSSHGHIARSEDGGANWSVSQPTGSNPLPISQIKAIDDRQAFALTQGRGTDSRLYHTRNGGFSWNRVYRANGSETLRCFDLIPDAEAWVLGDGHNDSWHVVRSTNGRRWLASRSGFDQSLQPGEGAFSESASCVHYANDTWAMGSAYGESARLMLKSTNALRFNVHSTPIRGQRPAITAVYPLSNREILFTGGDLEDENASAVIWRWHNREAEASEVQGLSGVLTNLQVHGDYIVVANQSGVAWRQSQGEEWQLLDTATQQLSCVAGNTCFSLSPESLYRFVLND